MMILQRLWESTAAFHKRFELSGNEDRDAQYGALFEEIAEFSLEILAPFELDDGGSLSEGADVMVTIIGLLIMKGYTLEDLQEAMEAVAAKNDAKTIEAGWGRNAKGKVVKL